MLLTCTHACSYQQLYIKIDTHKRTHACISALVRCGAASESAAGDGGYGQRVAVGIGVLEGEALAGGEGCAIVDETVVEAEAAEEEGVYEAGRAEPAAPHVDVRHRAPRRARVQDLHRVRRDPIWQRRRRPLVQQDVVLGAFLLPHPLHPRSLLRSLPYMYTRTHTPPSHTQISRTRKV